MEESIAPQHDASPATDIPPARTIEPSKILTPPDMEVFFNAYRVEEKDPSVTPTPVVSQSPPVPHRAIVNTVNSRRMRSVSASAAFDASIQVPGSPLLSHGNIFPQPASLRTSIIVNGANATLHSTNTATNGNENAMSVEKETEGLRSPRAGRRSPTSGEVPLSPRGDVIPTEIPGSPKRKRHTVSVGDSAQQANAANGKKRRQRQKKTPTQVAVLERHFLINPHPDKQTRDNLALQLGFTSRQVQIWFQNARAKAKQNARKNGHDMGTLVNGTAVLQAQMNHKHPTLTMSPNGLSAHATSPQMVSPGQTPSMPSSPSHLANGANGGGGRKIFSPPPFSPDASHAMSPSTTTTTTSPPHSPISPYLSSLALSPRFPRVIPANAPHLMVHVPVNNSATEGAAVVSNPSSFLSTDNLANITNLNDAADDDNADLDNTDDLTSITAVISSMEEVPSTPPIAMSVLSQTTLYSEGHTSSAPLSPPPPASPLDDNFPQLSMSAPSPFSSLQKQMLVDAHNSMAGVTTSVGDESPYPEDVYAAPSSPPLPSPFGPPLLSEEAAAAVFISEQNQKAALMHMEHNPLQQQLLQQQQLFQHEHHTAFLQQHQQQHQQQQFLAASSAQSSSISEMDFFFYEAPSKNLVQFGEGEGDGDFFWGGVDSLNP